MRPSIEWEARRVIGLMQDGPNFHKGYTFSSALMTMADIWDAEGDTPASKEIPFLERLCLVAEAVVKIAENEGYEVKMRD